MQTPDVLVIGGGIIGLTSAYFLAKAGLSVEVLDRGDMGRGASWAGAGILPPGNAAKAATPIEKLRAESVARFPVFSDELLELTGIHNGFYRCQGVEFLTPEDEYALEVWGEEGIGFRPWCKEDSPGLNAPQGTTGYFLPGLAQVRNPWHLRALIAGCERLGVRLTPQSAVSEWQLEGERIEALSTTSGERKSAGQFVLATGAWSEELLAQLGWTPGVHPVRGQIVLFNPEAEEPVLWNVVMAGKRYLVPRADGRVLVGSTEEPEAGFTLGNTERGLRDLIDFARELVPILDEAPIEKTWSGLRPGTPDGLPFLGPIPDYLNAFAALGHFRSGVQLSIGTGEVIRDLVLGKPPEIPIEAFRLDREPEIPARPAFRS